MDEAAKLRQELSQARALLNNTVDTLNEERRIAAATKNRVTGGYYMMSRAAEKNLRVIRRTEPVISIVLEITHWTLDVR